MKALLLLLLMIPLFLMSLISCVTMDSGANWLTADFTAYDKNYNDFEIDKIEIEMTKDELIESLNIPHRVMSVTSDYEVLEFEKWRSVPGTDYVEERLLVKIQDDRVKEYTIVKDTVKTNPW